jgi:hypothetical protein
MKCSGVYFLLDNTCPDTDCPDGYVADTFDYICKKTRYPNDFPCPKGTFNDGTKKSLEEDCQSCDRGNKKLKNSFFEPKLTNVQENTAQA